MKNLAALADAIKPGSRELGLADLRMTDVDLSQGGRLQVWLNKGYHGKMDYMASYAMKRARPVELALGTVSLITGSMPYLPRSGQAAQIDWPS